MSKAVCPYLCAQDANNQAQPPIDYPSFENHCRATNTELLLLADQATFCLSGEYRGCARFGDAPARLPESRDFAYTAATSVPASWVGTEGLFTATFADLPPLDSEPAHEDPPDRRRWAWVGAAVIFVTVLLCGGSWAAYMGWQMVSERALAARAAQIQTLAGPSTPASAGFLVVTATSTAAVAPTTTNPPVITQAPPLAVPTYPVAVTPTPIVVQVAIGQPPAAAPISATQLISVESPPNIELPTPVIDLQLTIPPRRPTPLFDLPTSTPSALEPTLTPTPTLPLGTPVVIFAPVKKELVRGECTFLRWQVENVRAVYYENQGVNGKGEDEECIDDKSIIYTLMIVLGDGSSKIYTTTLVYLPPTITPTPTPTFTPEITPQDTPTWTPPAPSETPTPAVDYGVNLAIFGDSQRTCAPGDTCEFDLLVTNTGTARDSLAVNFTFTGPWPALLCAEGGDCSASSLTLSAVEPNGGKRVKLEVKIPADAVEPSANYDLQAVSLGSNNGATSNTVGVEAKTP